MCANFKDSSHFDTYNHWYTPYSAWEQISEFIPKSFTIYEAFLLHSNEQSKKNLEKLGYKVIGDKTLDFLGEIIPDRSTYQLIVSNPPFERISSFQDRKNNLKYKCLSKLLELNKPFIIILNSTNIFQKWFKELFDGKDIKFIFPSKKIEFDKYDETGTTLLESNGSCSFNSVYVTYKVLDKNEWV